MTSQRNHISWPIECARAFEIFRNSRFLSVPNTRMLDISNCFFLLLLIWVFELCCAYLN